MPESVGALWIKDYDFTRSFGVEPASASGVAVLAAGEVSTALQLGDYVAYSFGALVFYGIVSNIEKVEERETGREYTFQVVDNRVRLPHKPFFGRFNMPEDPAATRLKSIVRPPSGAFDAGPASGDDGMDLAEAAASSGSEGFGSLDPVTDTRGRIFAHILPQHHDLQLRCFTDKPVSAADILRCAFRYALGAFGFVLDLHPDCNLPVYEIDANGGMTLAALVAEVCNQLGLQVTLDGSRTIRFERRGEGTLVIPGGSHVRRDGVSLSADPTRVVVIGDRTLVQCNNLPLVPDWKRGWEAFLSEPAWLDEVARVFDLASDSASGRAEVAARAREVTLRQYLAAADVDEDEEWVDRGRWGKVSRLNMPVWTYLNSIIFRSYKIADNEMLFGVPLVALEIHDSLLCGVEIAGMGGSTAIQYSSSPVEFYPQASAFVIAKGQPLDLLSAVDREALVRNRVKDMRAEWSEIADFTLDVENHAVRFASPVFLDGDPAAGKSILLYPNKGEGGYEDVSGELGPDNEYLRVCVPNPGYEIEPAPVKVSLCFRLGQWKSFHGTGQRFSIHQASALALHLLHDAEGVAHDLLGDFTGSLGTPTAPGGGLKEIKYNDGEDTATKAEAQASALVVRNPEERSGEYIRTGVAGTNVSGVIDRVSVEIRSRTGIKETVEFSKPRVPKEFLSSRDFSRRARTEALFEGQKDLRRDAQALHLISRLERLSINDPVRSSSHPVMTDLFRQPVGGGDTATKTFDDPNSQWPEREGVTGWRAGDLVWLDKDGLPSRTGTTFAGVVVAASKMVGESGSETPVKWVTVATTGTIPLAVEPGVDPAHGLRAKPGDWRATKDGGYRIGALAHGARVPGSGQAAIVFARLGATVSGEGRYPVTFDSDSQKLYVGEGSVAWTVSDDPESVTRPYIPKLDGVLLTERPGWDVSDKELDVEYEVICIFHSSAGRMVLHEKDGEEDLEMDGHERARLIATVTFKESSGGGGVALKELVQKWQDDIEFGGGEAISSSGDSGSQDDDSEGGSNDDDSESVPDESDSDDGSGDDSDSGGSSSGEGCCPTITLDEVMLSTDGEGFCLPVDGPGVTSRVMFLIQGQIGSYTCPECAGRLWVEFGIAGQKQSKYLGLDGSGQVFTGIFEAQVQPCAKLTAWACIRKFGTTVSPGDACVIDDCCVYQPVQIPGACPDGECDPGSEDEDDSSSDDSSSSSSEEECECDFIVTAHSVSGIRSGSFTVQNNGTCVVIVDDLYLEGSISAYEPWPTSVEIPAGESYVFEISGAAGSTGALSGTLVEVRYGCIGVTTPDPITFVF